VVLALFGLTVRYTIPVFESSPEASQVAPTQLSNSGSSSFEEYMNPRENAPERTIIDPSSCTTRTPNIVVTKQETTCTVAIDLHAYPFVRGMVGFCKNLDTTSPENNAGKLVLIFNGDPLILGLFATRPEGLPGIVDDTEPPVTISGTVSLDSAFDAGDCFSLAADPN